MKIRHPIIFLINSICWRWEMREYWLICLNALDCCIVHRKQLHQAYCTIDRRRYISKSNIDIFFTTHNTAFAFANTCFAQTLSLTEWIYIFIKKTLKSGKFWLTTDMASSWQCAMQFASANALQPHIDLKWIFNKRIFFKSKETQLVRRWWWQCYFIVRENESKRK